METDKPFDEASDVRVEDGSVKMFGPDSVEVSLTPHAALETSDRLFGEAMKARGAKLLKDKAAADMADLHDDKTAFRF